MKVNKACLVCSFTFYFIKLTLIFSRHPSVTMVCAVFKAATQTWARIMEILGCPIIKIPLSASLMRSKGRQAIHLALALLQELLIRCQE